MQEQRRNVVHSMKETARQAEEEPAVREEKGKEEKEGRDRFPALESFSPSQHRPLNSTPLVETKSDTRKAKLLQMHKPSSVRSLSLPSLAHTDFSLFASLFPHLAVYNPPSGLSSFLVAAFSSPLSTFAPFSYPLILSQPFSLRKRRSAIHPFPFHLLASLVFSLLLSLALSALSSLFFLCSARGHSTSLSAISSLLFLSIRGNSRLLFYHSILEFRSFSRGAAA